MGAKWWERYEPLTARELEILRLVATGLTNQQIADQLFLTLDAVKWHNKQSYLKLGVHSRTQAVARVRERGLLEPTAVPQLSPSQKHNLPTQATPFIGREAELAEIQRLLLDEPQCRLVTLVGPGGIGKTRLALAAAAQMMNAFPDGVCFVTLVAVDDVAYIVPTIADALHFTFFGNADSTEQLLNYLRPKKLLLVVDNFEHLPDGSTLLSHILKHAPDVRLLTTSRERLRLQEEWIYDVQGLPYPMGNRIETESISTPELETYQAVQLFLQRARQIDAKFAPSTEEIADIVRVCQLVEGMPLGLELAAPWIRSLSCREIALEIERSLDFLTTTLRNLPERHRSLRVVLEQTWQHLSSVEQSTLRQLSVFREGFTREAAQVVTGATLSDLSSLIDKALLRRTDTGRYELHELIRQFGDEQLQADPDAVKFIQQRHIDFFIGFLERHTAGVKGEQQKATMTAIAADLANVRLAWQRVLAVQDIDAIERAAECLFVYYLYGNGYDEGCAEFGRAVNAFVSLASITTDEAWIEASTLSDRQEVLVSYLLVAHGYFVAHRRDLHAGEILLEQALVLLRQRPIRSGTARQRAVALAISWLGWTLMFQGRIVEGERCAAESLALFMLIGDPWGAGWNWLLLSNCKKGHDPIEAARTYRNGLTVCEASGDQGVQSYLSFNLGNVLCHLGLYSQAKSYIDQGIKIAEDMQNVLGLAYGLRCRGELQIIQGQYQQAIETLEQSLMYFNEVGTVHTSNARIHLARAYHLKGDYARAIELFVQSRQELAVAGSQKGLAQLLNGLGSLAYDQGDLDQAEQQHRDALAIEQDMDIDIAISLHCLGRVLAAAGEKRRVEAIQYFRQALDLAVRHQLAPIALAICVDVAKLRLPIGNSEWAGNLLALAEQHEASTFEIRERARQARTQMVPPVILESDQLLQLKEQTADLWTTVEEWLNEDEQVKFEA